MKGIGRLIQFGIAKEAVRGTAETAATYWVPFSELTIDEKDARVIDEQSMGVIEDSIGQSIVKQWSEATVKLPIGDRHFPLVLLSTLGALATADNADTDPTVKDHTITVAQSAQHQSLTLFINDPLAGADYKHANGVVSSLEMSFEQGKFLDYSINLKAKKGATATLTPSTTAENRFLPKHLSVKLATNIAGLDAASAINVTSLSVKIDKSTEDDEALGNITPIDFLNKQLVIEGTLEATWDSESDFKTAALAGTAKAMRIDLKNTDVTIGAAAKPEIKIDLAKVIFSELTRPIALNDIVKQTLNFKAYYSTADSKMIQIVATNIVASY